jgi:hypothetical protein
VLLFLGKAGQSAKVEQLASNAIEYIVMKIPFPYTGMNQAHTQKFCMEYILETNSFEYAEVTSLLPRECEP